MHTKIRSVNFSVNSRKSSMHKSMFRYFYEHEKIFVWSQHGIGTKRKTLIAWRFSKTFSSGTTSPIEQIYQSFSISSIAKNHSLSECTSNHWPHSVHNTYNRINFQQNSLTIVRLFVKREQERETANDDLWRSVGLFIYRLHYRHELYTNLIFHGTPCAAECPPSFSDKLVLIAWIFVEKKTNLDKQFRHCTVVLSRSTVIISTPYLMLPRWRVIREAIENEASTETLDSV